MSVLGLKRVVAASGSRLACRMLGTASVVTKDTPSGPPPPVKGPKKVKFDLKAKAEAAKSAKKDYVAMSDSLLGTLNKLVDLNTTTKGKKKKKAGWQAAEDAAFVPKSKFKNKVKAPTPTPPAMTVKGQKILRLVSTSSRVPYIRQDVPANSPLPTKQQLAAISKQQIADIRRQKREDLVASLKTEVARLGPFVNYSSGLVLHRQDSVLKDVTPIAEQRPIAKLEHGLDRVLFNPGVHWLQDPRSGVFNYPPSVQAIPKVTDFAFERLPPFTRSSRDEELWELARRESRTFAGSTSSLSGILSHIYFLLSNLKPVNLDNFVAGFKHEPNSFTPGQRMPTTVLFNYNNGRYAIDSFDDIHADKNILTWMGTLLEKYLTSDADVFSAYMRSGGSTEPAINDPNRREAYRFSKSDTFVMRSQLDCQDHRLPGTGVFDIKTRASYSIRMDLLNYENNSGYVIDTLNGPMNSFEKEYYDLVRSAFLKYSFQARIGNMDGVFVAYHNTERMFGFQYVPLLEMDHHLYGGAEPGIGDRVFNKCVGMLEAVSQRVVDCFPGQSVKATFETLEPGASLNVWVEPAEWTGSDPTPIKQLVVTTAHRINDIPTSLGRTALHSKEPWSIEWTVRERDPSLDGRIRQDLELAEKRKFRAMSLPDGVQIQTIMNWWNSISFNGVENEPITDPEFFASYFAEPDKMVTALRQLAQEGRTKTRKREQEEQGLPVFVVGQEFDDKEALEKKRILGSVKKVRAAVDEQMAADDMLAVKDGISAAKHAKQVVLDVPQIKIGFDVESSGNEVKTKTPVDDPFL